jgi:hypothetical protein
MHATVSMIAPATPAAFVAAAPPSVSATASVAHACADVSLSSPRSASDRSLVVYSGSNAVYAQATSVAVLRRVVRSTPQAASLQWLAQEIAQQPLALETVLRAAVQFANQLHHRCRGCPPPGQLHPQTQAPLVTKRVPKSAAHRRIQRSVIVSHARCRAAQAQHSSRTAAQNQGSGQEVL